MKELGLSVYLQRKTGKGRNIVNALIKRRLVKVNGKVATNLRMIVFSGDNVEIGDAPFNKGLLIFEVDGNTSVTIAKLKEIGFE